ncbi:uncharacterized protein LOC116345815 [Contarinia nasturtii]|uniref:uncharacterized protein LOC116345815 n=1 Tax=Contarinia nasturtii TaxID=265458 RepID=UPI0012D48C9B|nr:uncharacterized protein LOC116345815 [Contarinia nasturtii]
MSILNRIRWALPNTILSSKGMISSSIRGLFSGQDLGITSYEQAREAVGHAIANPEKFKDKLKTTLDEPTLIGLEFSLKNLLHIMENDEKDFMILKATLKTLIDKQADFHGEKYHFDAIIMRAFHYLNMPNEAIELFEDKLLGQLFTNITGYQILLDMLYENEKYDDVLRIHASRKMNVLYQKKHINAIILATYYRLNTPEAFKESYAMYTKLSHKHEFRKSRTFVAGLAVRQHQPKIALNIVENDESKPTFVTIRHIKLLAWAQLGQFEKITEILWRVIGDHEKNPKFKPTTSIEVLNEIERLLQLKGSQKDTDDFRDVRNEIQRLNLETNETLDDILCAPFPATREEKISHRRIVNQFK